MKNLRFKIIAALLGFLFAFTIAEIAYRIKLRFFGSYEITQKTRELVQYSENEKLLVELIPNASVEIKNTKYRVNSLGYRDSEWNSQDTTKVNIGLISDSVGFPFGLTREDGYEYITENTMNTADSLEVEVLNFALNGYNALQYIEVLKKVESQGLALDYLVANITSNDSQPTGKPSMLSWIDHPKSKYKWIPSKLIKRGIEAYYRKKVHPGLYSFSYIEQYIDYLQKFEIRTGTKVLVLLIPSKVEATNTSYYQKVKNYAVSKDVEVLFPNARFDSLRIKENINDYFYPNDKMHLSKKGHQIIADELSTYYKQFIKN